MKPRTADLTEPGNPEAVLLGRPHSKRFVAAWRSLVSEAFSWRLDGEFVLVPSLLGRSTRSYLPLLNYTDLTPADAEALAADCDSRPYQIRILSPGSDDLQPAEPVTMRLPLGDSAEDVFRERFGRRCRGQIRKAQRSPIETRSGRDPALIRDFYGLFARTSHRHGMPALPRAFLEAIPKRLDSTFYVCYSGERPIACSVAIEDGDLVWLPWGGLDRRFNKMCPMHHVCWTAIEDAVERKKAIFDFGRSPYAGSVYRFKIQWGALPVRVAVVSSKPADIYDRYQLAQRIWKAAPGRVVDVLGPRLSRYLVDY